MAKFISNEDYLPVGTWMLTGQRYLYWTCFVNQVTGEKRFTALPECKLPFITKIYSWYRQEYRAIVFIIFHLQIHSWEPYFSLETCWNDEEFLSLSKSFGLPSMFWTQKTTDQLKNFASPLLPKNIYYWKYLIKWIQFKDPHFCSFINWTGIQLWIANLNWWFKFLFKYLYS